MEFVKPRIVVSKCLGFEACRYNGEIINDPLVEKLKEHADMIPVCPEKEIGLGVPRQPIRAVAAENGNILYQPATGRDLTAEMKKFTDDFIRSLPAVDGFILKYYSPTCGPYHVKIYNGFGTDKKPLRGPGFFGGAIAEKFSGHAIEDEGRLKNFTIREHFLTRTFTAAAFRMVLDAPSAKKLTGFHARNKYLFMACSQTGMRKLGRIASNPGNLEMPELASLYLEHLQRLFIKPPGFGPWINVLQHVFGYFSGQISEPEKNFFLDTVEEYRDERIPLSAVTKVLHSWALRFNSDYILNQSFLAPYPADLAEISDSGKGRNL